MSDKFHAEIGKQKEQVLSLARLGEGMLRDATDALKANDQQLAAKVRERKSHLSSETHRLEEEMYSLIALYQPVAQDMRTIACSLRVISSSDRIGRYGKDIANVVIANQIYPRFPHLVESLSLPHMADLVLSMIFDSFEAYRTEDVTLIANHSARDDVVDALRHTIFREGITYMMEDPRTISSCTNYLMVARYLERCGDHACKIAEKVHYMVTGELVEVS
jgi:phosphate transport system protein